MKLYFKNSKGIEREIGSPKDVEEAIDIINKFCEERKFKIYYIRQWFDDFKLIFDVGSHTEFFHLIKEGEKDDN